MDRSGNHAPRLEAQVMRTSDSHVEEGVTFMRETDAAIQVTTKDGEIIWLPFSQVESIERERDGTGSITMTKWIAQQKGLT